MAQRGRHWYGRWHSNGRRVQRKLGAVRTPGTRDGLTRLQAEARLRQLIEESGSAPLIRERVTVEHTGRRLLSHLTGLGRKRSTLQGYESYLRVHLAPYFGERCLGQISRRDVEAFMSECCGSGQSVKSTMNYIGLLHSIFEFGIREGWADTNPCKLVAKPRAEVVDADIHFLDHAELQGLLSAVHEDALGRVDRVLYLAAGGCPDRRGTSTAILG